VICSYKRSSTIRMGTREDGREHRQGNANWKVPAFKPEELQDKSSLAQLAIESFRHGDKRWQLENFALCDATCR
jgi:hypothetical protein